MWSRVDDNLPHHPKFIRAGPVASWLWVCGNCYCNRYLTDGFIAHEVLSTLGQVPAVKAQAARLVLVGLWNAVDGGYRVHDFHDQNPTAASVKAKREADRNRKRLAEESARNPSGIAMESPGIPELPARAIPVPSHPIPKDHQASPDHGVSQEKVSVQAEDPPALVRSSVRPQELADAWNTRAEVAGLPRCLALTGARLAWARARLREQPDLAYWQTVIERIVASPFCCGENDRGWRADIDFLLRRGTHVKVLEGKYDAARRTHPLGVKAARTAQNLASFRTRRSVP